MTAAIAITAIAAAALFLPLGRWLGRRERPAPEVRPRTVQDAIAECSNVYELRPGPNKRRRA